jgi:DNA-binding transcriptional ArsR family regulator
MEKITVSCEVSAPNLAWLEREFLPARGIRGLTEALESLINAYRAGLGETEIGEPPGQRQIREALGRSRDPLTASQLCRSAGLSLPTVRAYLARLEALGHVRSAPVKTRTTYAAAWALTPMGRRAWIATIRDPEERTVAELAADDLGE